MKKRTRRKLKRFFNKHHALVVLLVAIISVVTMTGGYALLSQSVNVNGMATVKGNQSQEELCAITKSYTLGGEWGQNPYNAIINITLTNNSPTHTIVGWTFRIPDPNKVSVLSWDDTVYVENGYTYVTDQGYNETINANGGSVVRQLQIQVNDPTMSAADVVNSIEILDCGGATNYEVINIYSPNHHVSLEINQLETQLTCTSELTQAYSGGDRFYTIRITNNSNYDLVSWRLKGYYGEGNALTNSWPYQWSVDSNNHIVSITNTSNMAPGQTAEAVVVVNQNGNENPLDLVCAGIKSSAASVQSAARSRSR